MMKKKKMLITAFSSVLLLCAAIGGGTYALFTSSAQNTGSTIASGTLSLSTHRNDVPIEGPMFYTNDSVSGEMGTGYWAPKDTHTRAMLIKNTGTLDAKLTDLIAIPEGSTAEQADALAFGEQAMVTVAAFTTPKWYELNADQMEAANQAADEAFKKFIGKNPVFAKGGQEVFAEARKFWLSWKYRVDNNGNPIDVTVSDVFVGSLKDLYNGGSGRDAVLPNLVVPAKKTIHLGYNVTFLDDANGTFDNDALQGKSVKFTFQNNFEQVKNN